MKNAIVVAVAAALLSACATVVGQDAQGHRIERECTAWSFFTLFSVSNKGPCR